MRATCPAAKTCPLRCEECTSPDNVCMWLLEGLTNYAASSNWAEERQRVLQATNQALHSAFITKLAELSVTPQHEILERMLAETGRNGLGEMTAYEIYRWARKEGLL